MFVVIYENILFILCHNYEKYLKGANNMLCKSCGHGVDPNLEECLFCGAKIDKSNTTEPTLQTTSQPVQSFVHSETVTGSEKLLAFLAYCGILIIVPAVAGKTEYTKFHLGQGIRRLIYTAFLAVLSSLPIILRMSSVPFIITTSCTFIAGLLTVIPSLLTIGGMFNAVCGKKKPVGLIGRIGLKK